MSGSAINSATLQTYQSTGGGASSTAGTSGTSGAAATSGSTVATSAGVPTSSTIVTLSPDAQALAGAAAAGITVGQVSLAGLGISTVAP
jgi:hypothetical protein